MSVEQEFALNFFLSLQFSFLFRFFFEGGGGGGERGCVAEGGLLDR